MSWVTVLKSDDTTRPLHKQINMNFVYERALAELTDSLDSSGGRYFHQNRNVRGSKGNRNVSKIILSLSPEAPKEMYEVKIRGEKMSAYNLWKSKSFFDYLHRDLSYCMGAQMWLNRKFKTGDYRKDMPDYFRKAHTDAVKEVLAKTKLGADSAAYSLIRDIEAFYDDGRDMHGINSDRWEYRDTTPKEKKILSEAGPGGARTTKYIENGPNDWVAQEVVPAIAHINKAQRYAKSHLNRKFQYPYSSINTIISRKLKRLGWTQLGRHLWERSYS